MAVIAHTPRPPRPPRTGADATSRARGPSFGQLSRTAGTSFAGVGVSPAPFTGADALTLKRKYGRYADDAQGAIARALVEPAVRQAALTNGLSEGTAPELVVLGYWLERGFTLNIDLFFQTATFRDANFNPSGHPFPVDILVVPHGDLVYMPVDGHAFHAYTVLEVLRDEERNQILGRQGPNGAKVVPVSDLECQSLVRLAAYFAEVGL